MCDKAAIDTYYVVDYELYPNGGHHIVSGMALYKAHHIDTVILGF
jgi:hypothetical protein